MKQTTADSLHDTITVERQITEALAHLGYDLKKYELTIKPISYQRYEVSLGHYFGIWDSQRRTFVD